MENNVATTQSGPVATAEDFSKTFGDYTGSDYSRGGASYPNLIILQSTQTLDNFIEGGKIPTDNFGKLFIRSNNKNHVSDLRDSISGIIIKEQKGAELWVDNKQVFSANHHINAEKKMELANRFNCKIEDVKNVVKLLLLLVPKEKLYNEEEYEYAILTIKGAGFLPYGEQVKDVQQALFLESPQFKSMGLTNVSQVPVVFWSLKVSSKYVDDKAQKRQYYVYDFKLGQNKSETAFKLSNQMKEAAAFDLISMRKISDMNEPSVSESYQEAEYTKPEVDKSMPVSNEIVDIDDLTF